MPPKPKKRKTGPDGMSARVGKRRRADPTPQTNAVDITAINTSAETNSIDHAAIVNLVIDALEQRGVIPSSSLETPPVLRTPTINTSTDTSNPVVVPDITDTVHQALFNPSQPPKGIDIDYTLHSGTLSLGAFVPEKLKLAIWNGDFVELATLVDKNFDQDEITLRISSTGSNIALAPKESTKNINISKWISAFTIYMDIFIQKFPHETSNLLCYMNLIRDLERVHGVVAFNYYDRNFRAYKQCQPLPWGALHHELWIKATTMAMAGVQTRTVTPGKLCFRYNKIQGCNMRNCQYEHICGHCRKRHPQFRCYSQQKNTNSKTSGSISNAKLNYGKICSKPSLSDRR